MRHYKLKFRNRPQAEQLVYCEQQLQHISQLPPEQRPDVDLPAWTATITAARTSFDRVFGLRSELKAEISRRNQLMRDAKAKTEQAVGFVAVQAKLQPSALMAVRLELEGPKSPVGLPGAPTHLKATSGGNEGVVMLKWKRPIRRCFFALEMMEEGQSEWKQIECPSATRCEIENLPSGKKLWFRVAAGNAHGQGPWSNPVSVRVK